MNSSSNTEYGMISLDQGTAHKGLATLTKIDNEISEVQQYNNFYSRPFDTRPGSNIEGGSTATAVYWKQPRPITGNELLVEPAFIDNNYEDSKFFEYPKLLAHHPKSGEACILVEKLEKKARELGITPQQILDVFPTQFLENDLPFIKEYNEWTDKTSIRLVLTVPAGWPSSAHLRLNKFFLENYKKYGLESPPLIVTEPHAQLLFQASEKQKSGNPYKPGDKVMSADVGAGTSCLALIKITRADGSESIHCASCSITNGMEILSMSFGEMIRWKLKKMVLPSNFDLDVAVRYAICNFQNIKDGFRSDSTEDILMSIKGLDSKVNSGKLLIHAQEIRSLFLISFQETVDEMKRLISEEQKRRPNEKPISHILFSGGGSRSLFLRDELKKAFASEITNGLVIEIVKNPVHSVPSGGLLALLHASEGRDVVKTFTTKKRQSILVFDKWTNEVLQKYGPSLKRYNLGSDTAPEESESYCKLEHFVDMNEFSSNENIELNNHNKKNMKQNKEINPGYRDRKHGPYNQRIFRLPELLESINKGGMNVLDILVLSDQVMETSMLSDEISTTVVNPVFDEEGNIVDFEDLSGIPLPGVEISHEIYWNFNFEEKVYLAAMNEETYEVVMPYSLVLQENDEGNSKYVIDVKLAQKTLWTKGLKDNSTVDTPFKIRIPATSTEIKGARHDVMTMTKTCSTTYAAEHQDVESQFLAPSVLPTSGRPSASNLKQSSSSATLRPQYILLEDETASRSSSPSTLRPNSLPRGLENEFTSSPDPLHTPLSDGLNLRRRVSRGRRINKSSIVDSSGLEHQMQFSPLGKRHRGPNISLGEGTSQEIFSSPRPSRTQRIRQENDQGFARWIEKPGKFKGLRGGENLL